MEHTLTLWTGLWRKDMRFTGVTFMMIRNKTLEKVRAGEEWRNWPQSRARNPFVSIHILATCCALSHHWLQKSTDKDNGFIAQYRFPYNQIFPVFSSISKICSYLTWHFKKWKVFQCSGRTQGIEDAVYPQTAEGGPKRIIHQDQKCPRGEDSVTPFSSWMSAYEGDWVTVPGPTWAGGQGELLRNGRQRTEREQT